MRPRKVVVMIEMTTKESLLLLRHKGFWVDMLCDDCHDPEIHQVQVNVVKEKGGKAR